MTHYRVSDWHDSRKNWTNKSTEIRESYSSHDHFNFRSKPPRRVTKNLEFQNTEHKHATGARDDLREGEDQHWSISKSWERDEEKEMCEGWIKTEIEIKKLIFIVFEIEWKLIWKQEKKLIQSHFYWTRFHFKNAF